MTTKILGSATARSTATADAFFARWVDHESWPAWSPDTDWARVDGPVRTGAEGVLKPKGGPRTRFIVSACTPGREYTDTARFPGARLVFQHLVTPVVDGVELSVLATMHGPLAPVWAVIMGGGFRDAVPADLERLIALVEAEQPAVEPRSPGTGS
jgi:hypothetical protein